MQEAIRHGGRADDRPTREDIEPAARALVERHSGQLIATARRYSLSAEDAEDAYQRGLEIMLTRAPSLQEDYLVPWLKTVVKHEAFSIRKQRQRAEIVADSEFVSGFVPAAHEQAERLERLRVGVEAMSRLKPQEVRCLLLRAEGFSYRQICDETGFTYTKVNRCITEGRRSFLERVAGIESGAECQRLAPLLSRLVDGEATPEDLTTLRPHLRTCLACRATLRDFRETPARVAAFAPLLVTPGVLARALHRLHHVLSWSGATKAATVVAVTAAVAGGGIAALHGGKPQSHHKPPKPAPQAHHRPAHHHQKHPPPVAHVAQARKVKHHKKVVHHHAAEPAVVASPTPAPAVTSTPAPTPKADQSSEFGP
ncbi:MAG TPA: sigma-70 family RNA polymerase sigma factor [Thermoleophilaceae bacterium]|jgi:RNA polymerase sigma factor (sigma-70 family)